MTIKRAHACRSVLGVVVSAILSSQTIAQESERNPSDLYAPQLIAEMKQLHGAALSSDYAYVQLAHL
jgi:hypothetical protein